MDNTIETWRQGAFIDHPKYSNMGEKWKNDMRYQESFLVRPSSHGNAILRAVNPEIAKWVAERLNVAAKLERKISEGSCTQPTIANTGSNQLAIVTKELVDWLRSTGRTNKSRASKVPRKMLEAIEFELANCLRA
jgi:hypothetical protein